ncbi:bluetail domain-containing putative surface protein, partial [Synechococcus sp. UW140]|uniref:bluetail domain-containing putative surface protein n=1 Tax=Synechococcus sp. UW140 TaxID=368503 RepID=UPI0025FA66DA
ANDDLPSISLSLNKTSVLEDGNDNLVYTFTRTGPTDNTLTVYYAVSGTASSTTDYTGIPTTTTKSIIFAKNSSTALLTIDPKSDSVVEADEELKVTLSNDSNYNIVTDLSYATGVILNDDESSSNSKIMSGSSNSLTLTGTKRINGVGNDKDNVIIGNSNNNRLYGGLGKDILTGGGTVDRDIYGYKALGDSQLTSYDIITDFNYKDFIDAPLAVETEKLIKSIGSIATLNEADLSILLSESLFTPNSVSAFTVANMQGTFITLNDDSMGYQSKSDALIFLANYTLSTTKYVDFI